jgi:hypothetical protein
MEQQTGFYIDVGAGHPVADNVSLWFYERGWKGEVPLVKWSRFNVIFLADFPFMIEGDRL